MFVARILFPFSDFCIQCPLVLTGLPVVYKGYIVRAGPAIYRAEALVGELHFKITGSWRSCVHS